MLGRPSRRPDPPDAIGVNEERQTGQRHEAPTGHLGHRFDLPVVDGDDIGLGLVASVQGMTFALRQRVVFGADSRRRSPTRGATSIPDIQWSQDTRAGTDGRYQ